MNLTQRGIKAVKRSQLISTVKKELPSPAPAKMTRPSPPKPRPRSRLFGLDRAAEVAAEFSSADARTVLGRHLHQRRGSKVAWQMILRALDAGLLPKPNGMEASKVTMRFLFPYGSKSYLSRFDLLSTKDRPDIDDMLTRMIAFKDALLASRIRSRPSSTTAAASNSKPSVTRRSSSASARP
jgi:hypothetical protein